MTIRQASFEYQPKVNLDENIRRFVEKNNRRLIDATRLELKTPYTDPLDDRQGAIVTYAEEI